MDLHRLFCWAFHRGVREVLIAGVLPLQIDSVVYCRRCDRGRGRSVQVLRPLVGMGAR